MQYYECEVGGNELQQAQALNNLRQHVASKYMLSVIDRSLQIEVQRGFDDEGLPNWKC